MNKNDLKAYYYRGLSHINLGENETGLKVLRQVNEKIKNSVYNWIPNIKNVLNYLNKLDKFIT